MTVNVHGELTRSASPGDVVILSGVFLPTPYTGFRAMRAGLVADTYIEAMSIERLKKNFDEFQMTPEILQQIEALKSGTQIGFGCDVACVFLWEWVRWSDVACDFAVSCWKGYWVYCM